VPILPPTSPVLTRLTAATLAPANTSRRSLRPRDPDINYKIDKAPSVRTRRTQRHRLGHVLGERTESGRHKYLVERDAHSGSPNDDKRDGMDDLETRSDTPEADQSNDDSDFNDCDFTESDHDDHGESNDNANARVPLPTPPMSRGEQCGICLDSTLDLYNVLGCCRTL
jgi:hypothetical protein